ncbi:MAG: carbohydrate kinase family protein [Caldilineaceae bacterium]
MNNPAIICVGMATVDVLVQGVEALPRSGETGMVSGIALAIGGDATNQAVALAKLGNRVALWGVTGDDAQGQFIRQQCARRGIATDGLYIDPQRPTSTAIVLIDKKGEHCFLGQRDGASTGLGAEHLNLDAIQPGLKALSVGSLFYAPRFDREALPQLLQKAKAVGALTIADMVMDQTSYGLDALQEAWPYLDYVAPSELEAELLTGSKEPQAIAAAFQKRGVKNVILKRGANGISAFLGDTMLTCPAFPVRVVDTTGAGDNFVAGFVHGLAHGFAPEKALRFASAVAALSIQAVGAGAGLSNLQQVEEFLRQHTDLFVAVIR